MREERLLERIARWEEGDDRTGVSDTERLVTSVVEHLRHILNTRQGSALIDPDYGVPEFTNLVGTFEAGEVTDVAADMERIIRRYEPRLSSVKVTFAPKENDNLTLRFSVSGEVQADDRTIPLTIETAITAEGRITIRR
ncbi:MAG: type VI secretion system baseplate subunit TssE [Nitrospinae bacterium]|nr:type VI secretion system baseplate subunit TssE [Nitrospinota bacterium]